MEKYRVKDGLRELKDVMGQAAASDAVVNTSAVKQVVNTPWIAERQADAVAADARLHLNVIARPITVALG